MALVSGVSVGLDEIGVAERPAAVFRRTLSLGVGQERRVEAGWKGLEPIELDRVAPTISEVVEVGEPLGACLGQRLL